MRSRSTIIITLFVLFFAGCDFDPGNSGQNPSDTQIAGKRGGGGKPPKPTP